MGMTQNSKAKNNRRLGVILFRLARGLLLAYVIVVAFLLFSETSLVYPGINFKDRGDWAPEFKFEEINFQSKDGTQLVGWFLEHPNPRHVVLHCHGNGENVAQASFAIGNQFRNSLEASVFVFDYRGFGKSKGTPDEQGVLADAEAALAWLNQRTHTTPEEVVLLGHSLGGGPACYLANRHNVKAVILQRTFKSLSAAAQYNYPFVPTQYLMQNQFRSIEWLGRYKGPLFQSHGTEDTLIPIEHAKELHATCSSNDKEFLELDGLGHLSPYPDYYWTELRGFGQRLPVMENHQSGSISQ